eukprot:jgi/Psemu1/26324/gm1.26324_g
MDSYVFRRHFKTGFDVLCAINGHLVLTLLDRYKQTGTVRTRLNSKKGQFDKEEQALLIWEEALKYVSKEVFPDHEEGDSVAMDHMWAMGTEDITCYNNVGIKPEEWCNLMRLARKHIKSCIHFHPGNRPCLWSILWSKWSVKIEEMIIEKERLANLYHLTDTRFYSTDERFPVMGNHYIKHIDEMKAEEYCKKKAKQHKMKI